VLFLAFFSAVSSFSPLFPVRFELYEVVRNRLEFGEVFNEK
jgi:hypothetical protein